VASNGETRIAVDSEPDLIVARQKGRALAAEIGFDSTDQTLIATAISELSRNIRLYAKRGEIVLCAIAENGRRGIALEARDEGPGIADVTRALEPGFSTSGGLGLGLPGVRRLADEFEVVSNAGTGTRVSVKKWLVHRPWLESGVAGSALPGQRESGDAHVVWCQPEAAVVAVVDGLGHGSEATRVAALAVATIDAATPAAPATMIQLCHDRLRTTRGVVMSMAAFDRASSTMTWVGVGNVAGVLLRGDHHASPSEEHLLLRGGVIGAVLPNLYVATLPVAPGDTLVFATDGVRLELPSDLARRASPQQIANQLLALGGRGTDDALVVAVRFWGGAA